MDHNLDTRDGRALWIAEKADGWKQSENNPNEYVNNSNGLGSHFGLKLSERSLISKYSGYVDLMQVRAKIHSEEFRKKYDVRCDIAMYPVGVSVYGEWLRECTDISANGHFGTLFRTDDTTTEIDALQKAIVDCLQQVEGKSNELE